MQVEREESNWCVLLFQDLSQLEGIEREGVLFGVCGGEREGNNQTRIWSLLDFIISISVTEHLGGTVHRAGSTARDRYE